jgi:hypothetical protein
MLSVADLRQHPPPVSPGEFSRGGRRRDFSLFGVFDHFVESLACGMPRKPASIGEGTFQISTKGIILSRV